MPYGKSTSISTIYETRILPLPRTSYPVNILDLGDGDNPVNMVEKVLSTVFTQRLYSGDVRSVGAQIR
jgi:hypothetical protein